MLDVFQSVRVKHYLKLMLTFQKMKRKAKEP